MKITARLALCFVGCVQPAIAENDTNARLLSLAPEARATTLGQAVGEGCVGKTTFYMGMGKSGSAKDKVFWSIRCQDGRAFVLVVDPDGTGRSMPCTALKRVGGGECFKVLTDQ